MGAFTRPQGWARPLENDYFAVALYDTSSSAKTIITTVPAVGGEGIHMVYDVWDQEFVANTASNVSATVAPHGVEIMVRLPGTDPGVPTLPGFEGSTDVKRGSTGTVLGITYGRQEDRRQPHAEGRTSRRGLHLGHVMDLKHQRLRPARTRSRGR